jgi:hypothetical protein
MWKDPAKIDMDRPHEALPQLPALQFAVPMADAPQQVSQLCQAVQIKAGPNSLMLNRANATPVE